MVQLIMEDPLLSFKEKLSTVPGQCGRSSGKKSVIWLSPTELQDRHSIEFEMSTMKKQIDAHPYIPMFA